MAPGDKMNLIYTDCSPGRIRIYDFVMDSSKIYVPALETMIWQVCLLNDCDEIFGSSPGYNMTRARNVAMSRKAEAEGLLVRVDHSGCIFKHEEYRIDQSRRTLSWAPTTGEWVPTIGETLNWALAASCIHCRESIYSRDHAWLGSYRCPSHE